MRIEYIVDQDIFDKLRTFIKKGGRSGSSEMMSIEPIPGIGQPSLNIIRYMTDSGKTDDYGKTILVKNIMIENEDTKGCDRMEGIHPYDTDGFMTLTGKTIQYEFIPVSTVEGYFKERYYDSILMMLCKLRALDEKHKDEHDMIIEMIKEMRK